MKPPRCCRKVPTPKATSTLLRWPDPTQRGVPCAGLLPMPGSVPPGGRASPSLETLAPHPHVTRETQRHQSPKQEGGSFKSKTEQTEPRRAAGATARERTWRRRRRPEDGGGEGTGVLSDHSTRPRLLQSALPEKDRAAVVAVGQARAAQHSEAGGGPGQRAALRRRCGGTTGVTGFADRSHPRRTPG